MTRLRFAAPIIRAKGVDRGVVSVHVRNWPNSSWSSLVAIFSVPVGVSRQKFTVSDVVGMNVGVSCAANVNGRMEGRP